MANDIQKLYSLPDISFVSDVAPDFDTVLQRLVSDYEARYEEETGKKVVLRPGDKEYIELTVYAAEFFQMYQQIDFSAKMNLLKYSKGDYLKHLGSGCHDGQIYAFRKPKGSCIYSGRNQDHSRRRDLF